MRAKRPHLGEDPLWYKDAIIYELHVKTFYDSNSDGIGDFRGLAKKLDYLEDLGITAIWVLPFYPSPLKDDGYDIADYFGVHGDYGTLRDFKEFLREAHARGIRVITELVLNHTSDQHAWFQRSRRAKPGSAWRRFYLWSNTAEKFRDARIIFKDFESSNWTWDNLAKAYFWHRFYFHQPDLNFDCAQVQKAVARVMDYWFGMGVDGMRLDAVPYLFERDGTNCENLPETHEYLKKLRAYVDGKFRDRLFIAEANQWPEDAVSYFGGGEECQMAFHFPLMPRIFMAVQMEDRFPIIDILEQSPEIAESCQWALFLRNHDELTLEMVTDEERDYMYRMYAKDPRAKINLGIRRRLAPLLDNNRRKIELMNILLFSLPGTPVIYYGDEIGMGDNFYLGDRDGVRTPMQWSPDRNAGFSDANPQMLYLPVIIDPEYHYESLNVENQQKNLSSLLWWMKRAIAMRKRYKVFGRGSLSFLAPSNPKVLAFTRTYGGESILVIVNLSRFSQVAEIDLSKYAGFTPQDVFSQNRFPVIRESPYVLTLAPYWYHLFLLQREVEPARLGAERLALPELSVRGWENLLEKKDELENTVLPAYLRRCRWFAGKGRTVRRMRLTETIRMGKDKGPFFMFIEVHYAEGVAETYQIVFSFASAEKAGHLIDSCPQCVIARLRAGREEGVLYDGIYDDEVRRALLLLIGRRRKLKGRYGELVGCPGRMFGRLLGDKQKLPLGSNVLGAEQSNAAVIYDNTFFLKFPRRLEPGMNPDIELVRFLTERAGFKNAPPFAGSIEYRKGTSEPVIIAFLQGFVPNEGDAWGYALEEVRLYFERVIARRAELESPPEPPPLCAGMSIPEIPHILQELIGGYYLETARLLGLRTAQMHLALSSSAEKDFVPEPFSLLYQRSVYQSMRSGVRRVFELLRRNLKGLPENASRQAAETLALEPEILARQQRITRRKIAAMRFRIHGDYHLGQVLHTGRDFVIIDFEGEPARPLSERRLKRSPLRDVAGMMRSFHYAAHAAVLRYESIRPEDVKTLEPWAEIWASYVSAVFLGSYMDAMGGTPFIPAEKEEFALLLSALLLEKAVYELGYEINNRPDWVIIPTRGIKNILKSK